MSANSLQVAVIGTGAIGSLHATNLALHTKGARVSAVMDIDRERADAVAQACGARAVTDAADLIADPAVDAILIASPDASHAELCLAAIAAGKPVLCEKPLATSLADAERIVNAELAAGERLVRVGFMRQVDPAHSDLQALLASGQLGAPLRFRGTHFNPRRGDTIIRIEGAIVNSLIHDMHSLRWLMSAEVQNALVQWLPDRADMPRSARFALAHLTLDNGGLATLEWSGDSGYGYEVGVEIVGELGTAQTHSHSSPTIRRGGGLSQAVSPDWQDRFAEAYRIETQDWVDSIRQGAPTGPSAWDGYMSLVIADACLRSADSGLPELTRAIDRPAFYA
ncbi:MAG: Gfo/Idh/MocA family oxidoreductase [Chloroflexi bacterium]|nr:Gfo/Idh/MocA family oxidoreductase [Chloroflexota bacterium]